MLTRMYLYSTSTKLSIDVWLYLDRPGSLTKSLFLTVILPEKSLVIILFEMITDSHKFKI